MLIDKIHEFAAILGEFLCSADAPDTQNENPISQVGMSTDPSEAKSSVNENG